MCELASLSRVSCSGETGEKWIEKAPEKTKKNIQSNRERESWSLFDF